MRNPFKKKPNVLEVIKEIHSEFDSATDRLLNEAKLIIAKEIGDKGLRLAALGFIKTEEAVVSDQIRRERRESEFLSQLIRGYSERYPLNKFITEVEVERICKKYGLLFGQATRYKGVVPDKNLKEMESFKLLDRDKHLSRIGWFKRHISSFSFRTTWSHGEEGSGSHFGCLLHNGDFKHLSRSTEDKVYIETPPFRICAPIKDFDLKDSEIRGHKIIEIPDPIVLQPVKGGYLIVTKWGLEANDQDLVIPAHN